MYRTVEDPFRVIGFLALAGDIAPAEFLVLVGTGDDAESTCHPLRVSWSVGRVSPGASPVSSLVRYPRAAFWARMGRVSLSEGATVAGR